MCGIIGAYSKEKPVDNNWFAIARDSMSHRGPDDMGTWSSMGGKILLGHRRLSILDLSIDGHQPMSILNDEYVIVFNGEIYNYKEIRYS